MKKDKTTIKIKNNYGEYLVSVKAIDLDIDDFIEQLIKPVLMAAGYNESIIRKIKIDEDSGSDN
jgi:hypothetical protein